jgi:ATP-dependent DNA helicase RecQ
LFSLGDVVKQKRFIEEKPNPEEQRIAQAQLQRMVHYAEERGCRRVALLGYFGESFPANDCKGCDNCLTPRETFDGTVAAQKFLSCVYRIRERSGFSVGMAHVVAVLTGADTEKIRKWHHQELSTYAIGSEYSRPEWSAVGRELIRLGYLQQDSARFNVLELTPAGRSVLRERRPVALTKLKPTQEPKLLRQGEIACDEELFQQLRVLRKRLADERQLPPYIIFSDVSLRQMARLYPVTDAEFLRVSGVGERKRAEFGQVFLSEIATFLQTHPRQIPADERPMGKGPSLT